MTQVQLSPDNQVLTLTTPAGAFRFHGVWLRHNALDADTRDPGNGQRLITLADLPDNCALASAEASDKAVSVIFADDNKSVSFLIAWLLANAYDRPQDTTPGHLPEHTETWGEALNANVPSGHYPDLASNADAKRAWLAAIRRYGFAKVTGLPTESGALFKVVDLFGYVRETNYGRHFEVRTEVNPTNLAFTGLGLQAHTATPTAIRCQPCKSCPALRILPKAATTWWSTALQPRKSCVKSIPKALHSCTTIPRGLNTRAKQV